VLDHSFPSKKKITNRGRLHLHGLRANKFIYDSLTYITTPHTILFPSSILSTNIWAWACPTPAIEMDLNRNLEALGITHLDKISLRDLERKTERNIEVEIPKQQVLNTYLAWLKEQLVQDSFNQQDSLVETWIKSLRDRGYDKEHIHQSFNDWQRREAQNDPSTRRRFLIVEGELCRLLNMPIPDSSTVSFPAGSLIRPSFNKETKSPMPSRRSSYQDNKPPLPTYSVRNSRARKNTKASRRVRLDNPERSGANELPVMDRRPVGHVPHTPSREIIEIIDDGPSDQVGQPNIIKGPTHNNDDRSGRHVWSESDDIIVTRETVILDSPLKPTHPSNDPDIGMPLSKVDYIQGLKTGTLALQPPGPAYTCKRCKQKGEK
jgi:hypothetical protein